LEKQVETLNEKVTAKNRQISSLNEQVNDLVAKLATKEQSSSTNLKTPDPSKPPPPGVSESPGILSQTKPDSLVALMEKYYDWVTKDAYGEFTTIHFFIAKW